MTDLIVGWPSGCCPALLVSLWHNTTQSAQSSSASAQILPGKASSQIQSRRNPALFGLGLQRGTCFIHASSCSPEWSQTAKKRVLGVTVGIRGMRVDVWILRDSEWTSHALSFDKVRRNSYWQWNIVWISDTSVVVDNGLRLLVGKMQQSSILGSALHSDGMAVRLLYPLGHIFVNPPNSKMSTRRNFLTVPRTIGRFTRFEARLDHRYWGLV